MWDSLLVDGFECWLKDHMSSFHTNGMTMQLKVTTYQDCLHGVGRKSKEMVRNSKLQRHKVTEQIGKSKLTYTAIGGRRRIKLFEFLLGVTFSLPSQNSS